MEFQIAYLTVNKKNEPIGSRTEEGGCWGPRLHQPLKPKAKNEERNINTIQGVILGEGGGGLGGAVAPQLLANNTFFGVFTHH